jgi:hypothetical protein
MLYPLVPKQFASTDRQHKLPATSRNYSQVPNEIISSNARERELGRIAKRLAELAAERQALESARAALVCAVAEQSPARSIFAQQAAPQDKNSSSETKHANPNAPVNTDSRTSSSRALPPSESWPYRAQIDDLYSRSTTLTRAMRVRTGTTLPRCRFGRRRYNPLPHHLSSGRRSDRVPRAAAGCRSGRYARLNP